MNQNRAIDFQRTLPLAMASELMKLRTLPKRMACAVAATLCIGSMLGLAGCSSAPVIASFEQQEHSRVVGQSPAGSFFENIALGPDGALYVTDYTRKEVLRYTEPSGLKPFLQLDAFPLGIAFDADGTLYVSSQEKNLFGGGGTIQNAKLLFRARPGEPLRRWLEIPDANFLNGIVRLDSGRLLVADSRGGTIWHIDTKNAQASRYLSDPLLDTGDTSSPTPAANGVKLHQGYLYVSNTARALMLRIKVDAQGTPGKVEKFMEGVRVDDFEFSPKGSLYLTTHRDNVLRVDANGKTQVFANASDKVVGNTALIWDANRKGPYVIADGGFVAQQWYKGSAPGPATLVRFNEKE